MTSYVRLLGLLLPLLTPSRLLNAQDVRATCAAALAADEGAVSGTAVRMRARQPLAGVPIRLSWGGDSVTHRTVVTDSLGRFESCALPAGALIELRVLSGVGFSIPSTVRAIAGKVLEDQQLLVDEQRPPLASLVGQVVRAGSRAPLANAEVAIEGTAIRARSNSNGQFTIDSVPIGEFRVQFKVLGYTPSLNVNTLTRMSACAPPRHLSRSRSSVQSQSKRTVSTMP